MNNNNNNSPLDILAPYSHLMANKKEESPDGLQIAQNFNSEFGAPVTTSDLKKYDNSETYPVSGLNVSIDTLDDSFDVPDTVTDIQFSNSPNIPAPAVYAFSQKISLKQEVGEDMVAGRIQKRNKGTKLNTKFVASMYLYYVINFEHLYLVKGVYRNAQGQILYFNFTLDSKKYQNKYHQAFIDNGIDCFNEVLSSKDLSRYIKTLIQQKSNKMQSSNKNGFFINNENCYFVCVETCRTWNFPQLTDKHFIFEQVYMPDVITQNFYELYKNHEDPNLFLFLNVIRIASLYSTLLNNRNAAFCKVVVIKGEYNKIAPYLQIYGRMIEKEKEISVNMKSDEALELMSEYKDDIFLLNDESFASNFKQRNGEETIRKIADKVAGYNPETDFVEIRKYPYTVCVVSERLSNALDEKSAMIIDASSLTRTFAITSDEVHTMHNFDRYMIHDASQMFIYDRNNDYTYIFKKNYKDIQLFKSANTKHIYCICMEIFKRISAKISRHCEIELNKQNFHNYLSLVLLTSEANYSSNTIKDDFQKTLNQLILSNDPDEKAELVFHSKLTGCYGETMQYPVIYRKENRLLIHDDVFKFIVSKMVINSTELNVRQHLKENGLLNYTDGLKVKERLFGKKYNGDIWLTAVSDSILTDDAKKSTVGGIQNYTHCIFSDNQIFVGYDSRNLKSGLTLDKYFRRGLNIVGKNSDCTSMLADLIALQLAAKNEIVFLIDYSGNTISDNMRRYGFDETTIENLIYESNDISSLTFDSDIDEIYLENDSRRIFSFSDNDIERQLELFLRHKETVKNKNIFLILRNAGEFERKINKPFYTLMKNCQKLNISTINLFNGSGELRERYNDLVNKTDIKFFFTEDSAQNAEFAAQQNYLKPEKEFGELIYTQDDMHYVLTGYLEDVDGRVNKQRFIQLRLPSQEEIVNLFSDN